MGLPPLSGGGGPCPCVESGSRRAGPVSWSLVDAPPHAHQVRSRRNSLHPRPARAVSACAGVSLHDGHGLSGVTPVRWVGRAWPLGPSSRQSLPGAILDSRPLGQVVSRRADHPELLEAAQPEARMGASPAQGDQTTVGGRPQGSGSAGAWAAWGEPLK